jgi:ubiquinone/menaquinone biosynthesis C-methylase UbiE
MEYESNIINLKESFNKEAETYEYDTNTLHHKVQEYVIQKNLENELNRNKKLKILDSGGGIGKYAIFLAKQGYDVVLLDISDKSLSIANEKIKADKLNIQIICGNSEQTEFENNQFDFVMMNGAVISYSPNPEECIKESSRILREKGILWFDFFTTLGWSIELNNVEMQTEIAEKDECTIKMDDWDYAAKLFSIEKMENILSKNGFRIKRKMGLISIMHSLPLDIRYSNEYNPEVLEMYKKIELRLSNRADCVGNSWSCIMCAEKE